MRSGNNCADSFLESLAVTERREIAARGDASSREAFFLFSQWNVCAIEGTDKKQWCWEPKCWMG